MPPPPQTGELCPLSPLPPLAGVALEAYRLAVEAWGTPGLGASASAAVPAGMAAPAPPPDGSPAPTARDSPSPVRALARLRELHAQVGRVDLRRVHPTWWLRALQDESPAVRRLVATRSPAEVGWELSRRWGQSHEPSGAVAVADSQTGAAAESRADSVQQAGSAAVDPEIVSWVLALWTERLVGGEPLSEDDPLVIRAVAGLSLRSLYRLCRGVGLAKAVLAEGETAAVGAADLVRARARWLAGRLGEVDDRVRAWAQRDQKAAGIETLPYHRRWASLGLISLARLLAEAPPFRVRWALQQIPYPVARRIRSWMPTLQRRSEAVSRLEARLLKAAWDRLTLEGRLTRTANDSNPG